MSVRCVIPIDHAPGFRVGWLGRKTIRSNIEFQRAAGDYDRIHAGPEDNSVANRVHDLFTMRYTTCPAFRVCYDEGRAIKSACGFHFGFQKEIL